MADQTPSLLAALLDQLVSLCTKLRRTRHSFLPSSSKTVLERIGADGPVTVPQLARDRKTSRQNIQVIVNRLKATGLIETIANPAHKRSPMIFLTSSGREALVPITTSHHLGLQRMASGFSEDELRNVMAVLRKLVEALPLARSAPESTPKRNFIPVRQDRPATPAPLEASEGLPLNLL